MFHTLSELNEREKKERKSKKKAFYSSVPKDKERTPQDNYYGKGNKAYDHYNKKPTESLNVRFEKTKNKIKLIAFQNGFIINNGPFRDRAIPENNKFMEEVERGNIPHELTKKGINDLGILLINRKNEFYYQPYAPITQITQITQINPINPITINPSVNNGNNSNDYNKYINFEFDKSNKPINSVNKSAQSNFINNYSVNNYNTNYNIQPYKYEAQTQIKNNNKNKNQFSQYQFQDPLFIDIDNFGYKQTPSLCRLLWGIEIKEKIYLFLTLLIPKEEIIIDTVDILIVSQEKKFEILLALFNFQVLKLLWKKIFLILIIIIMKIMKEKNLINLENLILNTQR